MSKKLTRKQIEKLAEEIRSFLIEYELWVDTTIYFNGKAFSTDDRNGHYYYNDPEHLVVLEDQDPRLYFEYVGPVLSMSFEGPFYEVMNYGECPPVEEKFRAILDRYGLYSELGNTWNLSVFPVDAWA